MKNKILQFICLIPLLCLVTISKAQDTIPKFELPSFEMPEISTPTVSKSDSSIKYSDDALDAQVDYNSDDSMKMEMKKERIHLYGNASVKYETFQLTAGYILFDYGNNILIAKAIRDSSGQKTGMPSFLDDSRNVPVEADSIKYNYKTGKGIVYEVSTQEAGGYIKGSRAKIYTNQDTNVAFKNEFISTGAIYTSCDHPEPHFGIRSSKQKLIPDQLVVVGPSNLEVGGIPTPLWLPFGFFPLTKGKSSGLIFNNDWEYSPNWGYGIRNVGWYFGLTDNMDLRVTGDVYLRGSWGLQAAGNYVRRYKHRGNLTLSYSVRKQGDPELPEFSQNNAFSIRWSHSQDAKAHPSRTFSASVNFQTGNYNSLTNNNANNVLQNSISSNITYNKSWPGKPFNFSANASGSQNTKTSEVRVNFPNMNFNVRRITPFERKKNDGGGERWYEKIGFTYKTQLQNSFTTVDSIKFQSLVDTLPDILKFGVRHELPVSASFKVFKYFNITPSVNYTEKWYLRTTLKEFDNTIIPVADSVFDSEGNLLSISRDTTFGTVNTLNDGFRASRELSGGASISTQIFGTFNMKPFKKVEAIRHVIKPSVSMNFTPDYTKPVWGYYDTVQYDTRYPDLYNEYSVFEGTLWGGASKGGGRSLSFNVHNLVEAKIWGMEDTVRTMKKVKVLPNLRFSGNYNFAADSLKMSTINMSGNTTLFKQVNINFSMIFDPLAANIEDNRRIDTWEWQENKRLARWTSANVSLRTTLKPDMFSGRTINPNEKAKDKTTSSSRFGGIRSLNLTYDFRMRREYIDKKDTIRITTNSIGLSGTSVNITKKWKVTVGSIGYDFAAKRFTYPDFQLYRNLHCWEMGFSWQPQRQTYSFYIRVMPSSKLNFINIPYRRSNYDPLGTF